MMGINKQGQITVQAQQHHHHHQQQNNNNSKSKRQKTKKLSYYYYYYYLLLLSRQVLRSIQVLRIVQQIPLPFLSEHGGQRLDVAGGQPFL